MRRSRLGRAAQGYERVARLVEDLDELKGIIALLQSQGKVVVFATGSFDLVSVGQVRCLKDARSRGDFLIVGIKSDQAVRDSEGAGFPLNGFADRAEILGAFGFVDYITRVDGVTIDGVLDALRPSVLAVGAHEASANEIDAEFLGRIGCNQVTVGGAEVRTTRDTLNQIWALNTPSASQELAMKETAASGTPGKVGSRKVRTARVAGVSAPKTPKTETSKSKKKSPKEKTAKPVKASTAGKMPAPGRSKKTVARATRSSGSARKAKAAPVKKSRGGKSTARDKATKPAVKSRGGAKKKSRSGGAK